MLTLLTDFCFFYMCTKHCQLIVRSPFPIVEGGVCVSACLCLCEWVGDSYEGSLEEGKGRDTTRIPEKGSGCHKIRERLRGNWKSDVWDKGKGEEFWWTFRCHKHPVLPYFLGTWSFTSRLLSFRWGHVSVMDNGESKCLLPLGCKFWISTARPSVSLLPYLVTWRS